MAIFRKWGLRRFYQKPRLASVWPNLKIWPLHLTTFDQKPPGAENAVQRRSRRRFAPRRNFWPKTPVRRRPSAPGPAGASERRGFLGKFFVKFWANFCTLPREKIFARFRAKNGAPRRLFREKFREIFARNSRNFSRKIARGAAKIFSRAPVRDARAAAKNPGAATVFARFARENLEI